MRLKLGILLLVALCVCFPAGRTFAAICDAGYGQNALQFCEECERGKYGPGDDTCILCPVGYKNPLPGKTACYECVGTYQPEEGQKQCIDCPTGKITGPHETLMDSIDVCACNQGTFGPVGEGACSTCPAGKMRADYASLECEVCPQGKWSNEKSNACHVCAFGKTTVSDSSAKDDCICKAGTYASTSTVSSASSCQPCPAGKAGPFSANQDVSRCVDCPAEYYNDRTASTACTACPLHSSQPNTGQATCLCDIGYQMSGVTCRECAAGRYRDDDISYCAGCAEGKYQAETGQTFCNLCPAGLKSTKRSGAESCAAPEGYYVDEDSLQITPCPVGTFKDSVANYSDDCESCEDEYYGTTSTIVGAFDADLHCQCKAGYYGEMEDDCSKCPSGRYKMDVGATQNGDEDCTPCPEFTSMADDIRGATDASQCLIIPGYTKDDTETVPCPVNTYKAIAGDADCTPCPEFTITDGVRGATDASQCLIIPGYTKDDTETVPCPVNTYKAIAGDAACTDCPIETPLTQATGSNSTDACFAEDDTPLVEDPAFLVPVIVGPSALAGMFFGLHWFGFFGGATDSADDTEPPAPNAV